MSAPAGEQKGMVVPMDDVNYPELLERIEKLETRIKKLEESKNIPGIGGEAQMLLERHPLTINKSDAARALGVTRHTVYNMIRDGRLKVNSNGKIPTRDLIDYITRGERYDGKAR